MANDATYTIEAYGNKENLIKFKNILLENTYDFIINPDVKIFSDIEENHASAKLKVTGECKCNIANSMLEYGNRKYKNSIEKVSKDLGLLLVMFSHDYLGGYIEHVILNNGECRWYDSEKLQKAFPQKYGSVKEFNNATGLMLDEQEWKKYLHVEYDKHYKIHARWYADVLTEDDFDDM